MILPASINGQSIPLNSQCFIALKYSDMALCYANLLMGGFSTTNSMCKITSNATDNNTIFTVEFTYFKWSKKVTNDKIILQVGQMFGGNSSISTLPILVTTVPSTLDVIFPKRQIDNYPTSKQYYSWWNIPCYGKS